MGAPLNPLIRDVWMRSTAILFGLSMGFLLSKMTSQCSTAMLLLASWLLWGRRRFWMLVEDLGHWLDSLMTNLMTFELTFLSLIQHHAC